MEPTGTVWAAPAAATGGWLGPPVTVTVTVDGVLLTFPSLTIRRKVRVAGLAGAVKVGLAAVVLERVTGVPAVWVHW